MIIKMGEKSTFAKVLNKIKSFFRHKHTRTAFKITRKTISAIFSFCLSIIMVVIITGTIVASAMTVYILEVMGQSDDVTIDELKDANVTYIYGYDKVAGEYKTLHEVSTVVERIPITIDQVSQHTRDAFVFAEDERFYEHDGVDFRRTFLAVVNEMLGVFGFRFGASTITQQARKNITGDDAGTGMAGIERKVREIFSAMELEKKYPKLVILEAYLNIAGFGGSANGIQMAAQKYFGKDVSELNIAESACLAAIPKSPEVRNPFASLEKNRERMEYVLKQMFINGAISVDEYEDALAEKLILTNTEEYKQLHPEEFEEDPEEEKEEYVTSYVVDAAIYELSDYFMEQEGITRQEAISKINNGGYKIYVTADLEMQKAVEAEYKNHDNFVVWSLDSLAKPIDAYDAEGNQLVQYPQSTFIAMDYQGNILATVGGIGEKTTSLSLNRSIQSTRQPGSCIKPISTYGYGLSLDVLNWSTMFVDKPITLKDGKQWPVNWSAYGNYNAWTYSNLFTYQALAASKNTIPAQLCETLGPENVWDFMTNKLQFSTLVNDDKNLSPMAVGALTYGVTLKELVNGYVPYGNGGSFYEATIIEKVEDSKGNIVIDSKKYPTQAVDPQTAYVMNKLLQQVVTAPEGTGKRAALTNKTVAGKSGTSQDNKDLLFMGMTEDFVSAVWYGYDQPVMVPYGSSTNTALMWKNVIGDYANNMHTGASYPANNDVVECYYCTQTGLRATSSCPHSARPGYYKSSNVPGYCTKNHTPVATPAPTEAETTVTP